MTIFSVTLKTHSQKNITDQCNVNNCIIHGTKPLIQEIVVGRRKETLWTASCVDDECGKITSEGKEAIEKIWNKWNS